MSRRIEQYLITGAAGQLGRELIDQFDDEETIGKPHEMLDVTDHTKVQKTIKTLNPNAVIHCAAITDMDKAQENPGLAWKTNTAGTDNVVKTCALLGVPLIYISSQHVFGLDESRKVPLRETDPTGPVNWLGVVDAAAEQAVLGLSQCMQPEYWSGKFRYWVLRTSELYGRSIRPTLCGVHRIMNRFETMTQKQSVYLVDDVVRSYTYAPHFAKCIVWLARHRLEVVSGVYNIANRGETTPYRFGAKLASGAKKSCSVTPIPRESLVTGTGVTPKNISRYAALNLEKWHEIAPFVMPTWEEAAEEFTREWRS